MAKWQPKPDHKGGFYPESKVYFDGSHFIAIPHTNRPQKPRKKPVEEVTQLLKKRIERTKRSQLAKKKTSKMKN